MGHQSRTDRGRLSVWKVGPGSAGFSLSLVLAVLSVPCGLAEESRGFGSARAGFSLSGTSVLPEGDAGPGGPACLVHGWVGVVERGQRAAGGDWQAGHRPQ